MAFIKPVFAGLYHHDSHPHTQRNCSRIFTTREQRRVHRIINQIVCVGSGKRNHIALLFVRLRLHAFQIDFFAVDVALQDGIVDGNPVHTFAVEGEDVVVAILFTFAAEEELVAAFMDVPFHHVGEPMNNVAII